MPGGPSKYGTVDQIYEYEMGVESSTHRELSNAYKNLFGTPKVNILFGRPGRRWTGNIKM
jgi:hypothetical protein